jgi:8-oxo-dGTP diphosphatase
MHLKYLSGEVKISDEHDDYIWADLDKIKSLAISSAFKKVLDKKNWEI